MFEIEINSGRWEAGKVEDSGGDVVNGKKLY